MNHLIIYTYIDFIYKYTYTSKCSILYHLYIRTGSKRRWQPIESTANSFDWRVQRSAFDIRSSHFQTQWTGVSRSLGKLLSETLPHPQPNFINPAFILDGSKGWSRASASWKLWMPLDEIHRQKKKHSTNKRPFDRRNWPKRPKRRKVSQI